VSADPPSGATARPGGGAPPGAAPGDGDPYGEETEQPSVLSMMGLVAVVVAVVILVFFALGYAFGRLFL
jgi:hypothetical protein